MKKLVSIFVLVGIVLSSFFTSEALAHGSNNFAAIHASNSSNLKNLHKRLILLELSNETEDSEENGLNNIGYQYQITNYFTEILFAKDILNSTLLSIYHNNQKLNSPPIFIEVRSIRV